MPEMVRIKYVRSAIGRPMKQKRVIKALGFSHLQQSRVVEWSPSIKGMVNKVQHLLKIESVEQTPEMDEAKENATFEDPIIEQIPVETLPIESTEAEEELSGSPDLEDEKNG